MEATRQSVVLRKNLLFSRSPRGQRKFKDSSRPQNAISVPRTSLFRATRRKSGLHLSSLIVEIRIRNDRRAETIVGCVWNLYEYLQAQKKEKSGKKRLSSLNMVSCYLSTLLNDVIDILVGLSTPSQQHQHKVLEASIETNENHYREVLMTTLN
ncbi:hypothetical protein NPIL_246461 [Nephila pilipes]|uniref:Uncharacterized protein n=1 Tax=Nephila pilipes TaxID=299642 RepID=A0A8X6PNG9_NEPPI|nr:hypothetical protein NPIL_246461 [Nephila pilipes]